jgi:hypothetical protein
MGIWGKGQRMADKKSDSRKIGNAQIVAMLVTAIVVYLAVHWDNLPFQFP